jgi:hypothetical protein
MKLGKKPNDELVDKYITPDQEMQGFRKMRGQQTGLQKRAGVIAGYQYRTVKRDTLQMMQINLTEKYPEGESDKWPDNKIQHEVLEQCGQKYYFQANSELRFETETFDRHRRTYRNREIAGSY